MDRTQCVALMAAVLWKQEGWDKDFRRIAAIARVMYDAVDVELGCAPPRMEDGIITAWTRKLPEANQ